jgi:phage regulator Rha-like protein
MEELKKKFIVEEKLDEKRVINYTERILPFCKISKDGMVIIENKELKTVQQIQLALVARFLANYLDKNITTEISNKELSNSLNVPENQIAARMKELRESKFVIPVKIGLHQVNPLQIEKFLIELENMRK